MYEKNVAMILEDTNVFGISWLGNCATIKHALLLNVCVVCKNLPPTLMTIFDCTEHLIAGGKKDTKIIME